MHEELGRCWLLLLQLFSLKGWHTVQRAERVASLLSATCAALG